MKVIKHWCGNRMIHFHQVIICDAIFKNGLFISFERQAKKPQISICWFAPPKCLQQSGLWAGWSPEPGTLSRSPTRVMVSDQALEPSPPAPAGSKAGSWKWRMRSQTQALWLGQWASQATSRQLCQMTASVEEFSDEKPHLIIHMVAVKTGWSKENGQNTSFPLFCHKSPQMKGQISINIWFIVFYKSKNIISNLILSNMGNG